MFQEAKQVLVIYVGGTIGMVKNQDGVYVPSAPNKMFSILEKFCRLYNEHDFEKFSKQLNANQLFLTVEDKLVLFEILEYEHLLDSSNMNHEDWIKIAKTIETHYNNFDGFVILHGTDTMTYTSSVLSFMLNNLRNPVILTGSQIPIFEVRSDAADNVFSSIIFAATCNIPEVCVCFAGKLMRGNRTEKVSSTDFDAFKSPNYPELAKTGVKIKVNKEFVLQLPKTEEIQPLKVVTSLNPNVVTLDIFPTMPSSMLQAVLQKPVEGLVLKTYGVGNIPSNRRDLLEIIKKAVDRGVFVVTITQCFRGTLISTYEGGKELEDTGIIAGQDMTPQAALTKLSYVLGDPSLSNEEICQMLQKNLRGEMTESQSDGNNNIKNIPVN